MKVFPTEAYLRHPSIRPYVTRLGVLGEATHDIVQCVVCDVRPALQHPLEYLWIQLGRGTSCFLDLLGGVEGGEVDWWRGEEGGIRKRGRENIVTVLPYLHRQKKRNDMPPC